MNTEKLKGIWEKVKAAVKKVSKKMRILIAAALAVVLVIIVAVVIYSHTRPYTLLYKDLGSSDVSAIVSYLNEWGITDYRIEGGDTILINSSQEATVRGRLLMAGYPNQGFSYSSYYDNVGALSSESERAKAWLITTTERMEATIRTFENVRDVTVNISPGEDRRYVLYDSNVQNTSASVTLTMASGKTLTSEQAAAIRKLVAYGIEGMQMDETAVVIVDTVGNTYSSTGNGTFDSAASALKLQLEEQYSNKIRTQIMQLLTRLYGEDDVVVGVNCVVELGYSEIDDHVVHLPDYALDGSTLGAGIIGSIMWSGSFTLNPDGTVGGVVGTTTNSDFSDYIEQLFDENGNFQGFDISGQSVMDNSTTDTHTIRTAAVLTNCTVSIVINSTTAPVPVDPATVRALAANAAGIEPVVTEDMTADDYWATKITVVSQPFQVYEQPDDGSTPGGGLLALAGIPTWVLLAAAGGLLLFILLLVVILLIGRKRKKKKLRQQQLEEERISALLTEAGVIPEEGQGEFTGVDVMTLQTERSMELRQDIRKFAEENPEIAAQLLKTWVRGGDDDG